MAAPPEDKRPPMAIAMEWVSRITTIVLEMVLPGLGGQWLDEKFGVGFLGLLGFVFGVSLGVWHLILMSQPGYHRSRSLRGGASGGSAGADSSEGRSAGKDSPEKGSGNSHSGGAVNSSGAGSGG
jgi:hypothetical protein